MENQTKSYVVVLPAMNGDPEEFVFVEEEEEGEIEDLSHWEFIHSSDSDSVHFDPTVTNFIPIPGPIQDVVVHDDDGHVVDHDDSSNDGYAEPHPFHFPNPTVVTNFISMVPGPIQDGGDEHDHDDDQDDDDGYGYGYDLDDELVPKALSGKFGRQRMRKLGKRGFAKMSSKKSPILYAKPGCVHGKHGLGLKHSF